MAATDPDQEPPEECGIEVDDPQEMLVTTMAVDMDTLVLGASRAGRRSPTAGPIHASLQSVDARVRESLQPGRQQPIVQAAPAGKIYKATPSTR